MNDVTNKYKNYYERMIKNKIKNETRRLQSSVVVFHEKQKTSIILKTSVMVFHSIHHEIQDRALLFIVISWR